MFCDIFYLTVYFDLRIALTRVSSLTFNDFNDSSPGHIRWVSGTNQGL